MDTIREARDLGRWLSPDETIAFVDDFFNRYYPGTQLEPSAEAKNSLNIRLSTDARLALAAFTERTRASRRTRLESSTRAVLCLFDPRRTDVLPSGSEFVDPMHPLLRWIVAEISTNDMGFVPPISITVGQEEIRFPKGLYAFVSHKWELRGIRSEVVLTHRTMRVDDGRALDALEAERLIVGASRKGTKIPFARLGHDELGHAVETLKTCASRLNAEFGDRVEDFELENARRCSQQRTSARRLADRKIGDLEERARKMEAEGKPLGARLARDQIRKQQEILAGKLDRIGRRSESDVGFSEVAGGFILVD